MRAVIVLMLAASPLALAAPADAQSVIQDGRWVTGTPKPAPTPPPPPPAPVERAASVAPAPATGVDAPVAAPPAAPAPQFAPRAEVVQPLPPAPKPPIARAAAAPPPPPAPAPGEAGAMPPMPSAPTPVAIAERPPAPGARAETPPAPGATYAPPAGPLPPVRRADAPPPPPKPQRWPGRHENPSPPPPGHHSVDHHTDAHPMPHHARADHADAKPHRAPKHRWGGDRDGRWEGGWNAPGGWGAYRRPAQGWRLPRYWWAPEFVVVDYWTYDLAPPMQDDRWVRYYDDAVLVDRHGEVIDWVEGVDWNDAGGTYYAGDRNEYGDDFVGDYGADYAPPGYPAGGYIANGYYYPPAVTHTIRIHSEPVMTSRTYVTEEVVTTRGKGGNSYRRVQTKKCNC